MFLNLNHFLISEDELAMLVPLRLYPEANLIFRLWKRCVCSLDESLAIVESQDGHANSLDVVDAHCLALQLSIIDQVKLSLKSFLIILLKLFAILFILHLLHPEVTLSLVDQVALVDLLWRNQLPQLKDEMALRALGLSLLLSEHVELHQEFKIGTIA